MILTANQLGRNGPRPEDIEPVSATTEAQLTARVRERYPEFADIARAAAELNLTLGNTARLKAGQELRVGRANRAELERRLNALDKRESPYPATYTLNNSKLFRLI